jgi:hypothetical protein
MWEKTWIQRRGQLGIYHTLVQELALEDAVCYKQYVRMSPQLFRAILEKIAPAITKQTHQVEKANICSGKTCNNTEVFGNRYGIGG